MRQPLHFLTAEVLPAILYACADSAFDRSPARNPPEDLYCWQLRLSRHGLIPEHQRGKRSAVTAGVQPHIRFCEAIILRRKRQLLAGSRHW